MRYQNEKTTEQLIQEFIANGGKITICKPKLAPKKRGSRRR